MTTAKILRDQLAARLEEMHAMNPAISRAFRAVERHLFVPDVGLNRAYQDDVIFTKASGGISLSASSAPSIMAEMLELLDLRPGQRVLEIGAGTGYNAAIMEEIVGPAGTVVTIDIDQENVDGALAHLRAAGHGARIAVHCADGGFGWVEDSPYDRIIVTVGAWDVPPAWLDQLVDGGRLVVPLEFQDVHKLVTFERHGHRLVSVDVRDCRFVRPQGVFAGPKRQFPLIPGMYLSTSRPHVDCALVAAALEGSRDAFYEPLSACISPEELHRAFRLWLALRDPDFCLVSLEEIALRSSRVLAWQTTAQRAVVAADKNSSFASVPGLVADEGICLIERSPDDDRRPILRGYGYAREAANRLNSYIGEWSTSDRPFSSDLTIVAIPADEDVSAEDHYGLVAEKTWFRYILRPAPAS